MMKVITIPPRMMAQRTGMAAPLMTAKLSKTVKVRQIKTVARRRMKGIGTPRMKAMPALPHTLTICLLMIALKALENVDEEIGSSTEDALASAIKSELASASLSDYRPYNRSYDFLGPIDEAEEHIKRARKLLAQSLCILPLIATALFQREENCLR